MEAGSLFPSADNLWKFLFLGGIFMVVFAVVYPLEKKQQLEIESNAFQKDTAILNEEMRHLLIKINEASESLENTMALISKLKLSNSASSKAEIDRLVEKSALQVKEIREDRTANKVKNISLSYEKKRIGIISDHIKSFNAFKIIFLIIGVISFIGGLIKWVMLTNRLESIQKFELNEAKVKFRSVSST